jgi:hypothetical protein
MNVPKPGTSHAPQLPSDASELDSYLRIFTAFRFTKSNVHLRSTRCFTMFYVAFFVRCCHLVATFELRRLEISWKINLDHTVAIRNTNNLHCKELKQSEHKVITRKQMNDQ